MPPSNPPSIDLGIPGATASSVPEAVPLDMPEPGDRVERNPADGLSMRDKDRFVRLWAAHKRRVYCYVVSLVPNWADADEVFQETNIRLWRDFNRFDGETDFGTWAISVAYYQVLTWRKRQTRSRLIFDDETINAIADQHEHLLPVTEARFLALRECFQSLHQRHRELITKFYSPGSNIEDIGASLGKTASAVYKALQRVRGSLRTCIDRQLLRDRDL
jgi:RNA polymerase sigma-70 factor (ECF subfamily)